MGPWAQRRAAPAAGAEDGDRALGARLRRLGVARGSKRGPGGPAPSGPAVGRAAPPADSRPRAPGPRRRPSAQPASRRQSCPAARSTPAGRRSSLAAKQQLPVNLHTGFGAPRTPKFSRDCVLGPLSLDLPLAPGLFTSTPALKVFPYFTYGCRENLLVVLATPDDGP